MKAATIRLLSIATLLALAHAALPPHSAAQLRGVKANERATVVGRLELAGRNYHLDPRFVIVDDSGNRVYVTAWAPLEVPPPIPGREPRGPRGLVTMDDFLGRRLSVSGIYRSAREMPARAKAVGAQGENFLDVDSVTDVATAKQVYTARPNEKKKEEGVTGDPTSGTMGIAPATPPRTTAPQPKPSPPATPRNTPPPDLGWLAPGDDPAVAASQSSHPSTAVD